MKEAIHKVAENSSTAQDRFRPSWDSSGDVLRYLKYCTKWNMERPGTAHSVEEKQYKQEIQVGIQDLEKKCRMEFGICTPLQKEKPPRHNQDFGRSKGADRFNFIISSCSEPYKRFQAQGSLVLKILQLRLKISPAGSDDHESLE
ncbi:hypothetical protein T265_05731 [Opisthorchis viverrini]|uniref:Uncharacterized protein n=1 Tax=Opisthorchis viverrini TaxID=6198 RepID=A0A074ZIQ9_OPIVI|nr:hypothetical protein T265_05731 [Opisthorchis viverrini]KER27198.1 hypothetical protein T265_05731 [Opisthorchis viverrini]